MAHVCSKRSKQILANARLVSNECGTVNAGPSSIIAKPSHPPSPLPSWWHDIYDAHDLDVKLKSQHSARRKLFISPVKCAVATTSVEKISPSCNILEAPSELRKQCDLVSDTGPVVCDDITYNCATHLTSLQGILETRGRNTRQEMCKITVMEKKHTKYAAIEDITDIQSMNAAILSCSMEFLKANDYEDADPSSLNVANSSLESNNANEAASPPVKSGSNVKNKFPSHMRIEDAKLALNSGIEHTTPKGKVRKARSMRQSCLNSCKRCVHPRLTNTERLCLNKEFWGLKNHMEQWQFISKSIKVFSPKKKFVARYTKGEKLSSRSYFFLIHGQPRKVCKTMFKSTLCICDSWIDNAILHRSDSGEMLEDRRGKHMNRPKRGHNK